MFHPISDQRLAEAVERYRAATGRDPREDQPGLDGDEATLGLFLIMAGYSPFDERENESGTVLPFKRPRESTARND